MGAEAEADVGAEQVGVGEIGFRQLVSDLVGGGRDDLRQAQRPGGRFGVGLEEALLADQGQEQQGREAVGFGLRGDQV